MIVLRPLFGFMAVALVRIRTRLTDVVYLLRQFRRGYNNQLLNAHRDRVSVAGTPSLHRLPDPLADRLVALLPGMVELFVYNWFYTGYSVYGHCLDGDGKYALLNVRGFHPSCYIEGNTVPVSSVVPLRAEYKRMVTSRDVSAPRSFYRLYFNNAKEMDGFFSGAHVKRYMVDTPQIAVFLSQVGADHVGWVSVPATDGGSMEYRCKQDDITPLPDRIPYSSPRILVFDIEVKSSDLGMPQPHRIEDTVEMISVVVFDNCASNRAVRKCILHTLDEPLGLHDSDEIAYDDEPALIRGFFGLLQLEDPTIITGFNIFGFDIHYLLSRLRLRLQDIPDVSRGLKGSVDIIRVDWASDAYGHNQYDRLVIGGRLIIDMFLYFKRIKLDRYSLDSVSKKFLGEGKSDMPYERMRDAFFSGDRDTLRSVAEYCIQDSVLVMMLFEKVQMWIDVCEMSKITQCNIEDIYTRGEQMKLVSQCVRECVRRNMVLQPQLPSEWREYEGAYVIEPRKGVYNGCCILDFQSLYPSIIIAFNICPSTYTSNPDPNTCFVVGEHGFRKEPVGLLPGMIKSILDERKAVKEAMKDCDRDTVEYTVLDRRQNALKVCANSVYGLMGFKNSRYFGHVGCAESVTAVGRVLLADIIKMIEAEYPLEVVYGDTDSCMLWHRGETKSRAEMEELGTAVCDRVTGMLPYPMALKFESYYDKVVLLTKKRYILVCDGRVSYKGVMNARRDYCKFAKDTYKGVIEIIAAGMTNDTITSYIDNRMLMLLCSKCDIEDMVVTKSLSKDLRAYKVNQPHVVFARKQVARTGIDIKAGTRLEYVYVKGEEAMVTPEDAAEDCIPIDGSFYIRKQIATQVDDVLSAIGLGGYIKDTWCTICG
jgi:DNA polymerase delta subunit 1